MERNETTLIKVIETTYFQHLVQSYRDWSRPRLGKDSIIQDNMLQEFKDGLSHKKGRNYIKIITSRNSGECGEQKSVHSFIVLKPTKGYEIGDILKAASWNAPATNFKRGNVFNLETLPNVTWTGAG